MAQLSVAARVGLRVPKTLITSDPAEALNFLGDSEGAMVHKAMTSPQHKFLDSRLWDANDAQRIDDLPLCPTIFQERIIGPADVRATVVGDRILSARIETSDGCAGVDSRLDGDAPCTPCQLPIDVEDGLRRLMKELGLVFGTIDLKIADNGDHVFLEVNPQGQFIYIEIRAGLPISDTLAEFLAYELPSAT
jgi:glutathione synthase/RimK-type ligase-like ATP-grasp enzyme